MDALLFDWPWFGLGLAAVQVGWLALAPRGPGDLPRWRDPVWPLRLLWPMYLIHQFEEHGVDALGRPYAFLGALCSALGFSTPEGCPADPAFIFAVNVVGCWIAFAMPWLFARSRPLVAACAWGVPLVNAGAHIGRAIAARAYNPGLLTSVVLFVPLGAWVLRPVVRAKVIERREVPRLLACGVAVHAVLIGSVFLRMAGLLPYALFLAINGADGLLPLVFGHRRATPPPPRSDQEA